MTDLDGNDGIGALLNFDAGRGIDHDEIGVVKFGQQKSGVPEFIAVFISIRGWIRIVKTEDRIFMRVVEQTFGFSPCLQFRPGVALRRPADSMEAGNRHRFESDDADSQVIHLTYLIIRLMMIAPILC